MTNQFQQELLNASDVCSNCFGRLHRDGGWFRERVRWRTVVDEVPYLHVNVRDQEQLFCECGAGGAFVRIWEDDDVWGQRFRELLTNALVTALHKGIIDRDDVAPISRTAWEGWKRGLDINDALAEGFAVRPRTTSTEMATPAD